MMIIGCSIIVAGLLAVVAPPSHGETVGRLVLREPVVTPVVFRRFEHNLQLDDERSGELEKRFASYRDELVQLREQANESARQARHALQLELLPELEASVELDALDAGRREYIEGRRLMWQAGSDPLIDNRTYLRRLGSELRSVALALDAKDEAALRRFRLDVMAMLHEREQPGFDRSWHRLTIDGQDLHRGPPFPTHRGNDPAWRIDLFGLLEEAGRDELEPLAAAFAINGEIGNEVEEEIAEELKHAAAVVARFEVDYARLISTYARKRDEWSFRYEDSFNRSDYALARTLLANESRRRKRLFAARLAFVDEIGWIAHRAIGPAAREAWQVRVRRAVCPSLFTRDAIDELMDAIDSSQAARRAERLQSLRETTEVDEDSAVWESMRAAVMATPVAIDEAVMAAVRAEFATYVSQRRQLREREFALEIEDYCTGRLPLRDEPQTVARERLDTVHAARMALTRRTHERIVRLLPPEVAASILGSSR